MDAFADLQFYRVNGCYSVKEFALVTQDGRVAHYVFESPPMIDWTRENLKNIDWVYRNHHGLNWFSGFVSHRESKEKIANSLRQGNVIFVKGYEKMKFLEKNFNANVRNIENFGLAYKIKNVRNGISCIHHRRNNDVCALRNVFYMKNCMNSPHPSVDPR